MLPHLTLLLLAGVTCGSIVKPSGGSGGTFELLILHNNDMHARFEQTSQLSGACAPADRDAGKCYGGFPRVAHVVKEARKAAASGTGPPVLYLNAGDTYTGTAWFTIYKWKVAAEFLNALQPDAVSLGNHEFDNGVSGLTPFIRNLTCPVLAANLDLSKVPKLEKESNLRKSFVFNISNKTIGVIGYLTPETKYLNTKNDVEYIDEVVALKEEVAKMRKDGIDIIIALGHSGYTKDLDIAEKVVGLDLVIGGHTNTFLWNGTVPDSERALGPYPTYVTQPSGKKVPVVQAYAYTKYMGKLLMVFNNKGKLINIDGEPILLDKNIPEDKDMLKIVKRYQEEMSNITGEVVGNTSIVLEGLSCQHTECNLGNLITDAIVYRYSKEYKGDQWTDAPIAIVQGGGIRASIAHSTMPTDITKADLMTVLPFEGELTVVTLKGSVVLEMLEHSVQYLTDLYFPGEFLQVSGLRVTYDLSKKVGSRVVSVEARCSNCSIPEYELLDTNKVYNVILPGFIQKGGNEFDMLKDLLSKRLKYDELSCTEIYMRQHSPVYAEIEGRITILNGTRKHNASSNLYPLLLCLLISLLTLALLN